MSRFHNQYLFGFVWLCTVIVRRDCSRTNTSRQSECCRNGAGLVTIPSLDACEWTLRE
ncbi:hypothetical protein CGRA01v4_11167 [Colletotrichum graminicola]|nr:hypothetical protein CGRA01v4_11167 [Colletotrichum graminicola]